MTNMAKQVKIILITMLLSTASEASEAPWIGSDFNGAPCPFREQDDGPYDYLVSSPLYQKKRKQLLRFHLTPNVLNHIKGKSTIDLSVDLDFAIRVFPNHHIALLSLSRYKIKLDKKILKKGSSEPPAPVECYFQRAINFTPKDIAVFSIYAYFLKKMGRFEDAEKQYKKALELSPKNTKVAYSYSLLLIDLKKYNEALEYAKKAYQNNRTPKALKEKLKRLGIWK